MQSDVRWSASTVRSSSAHVVSTMRSSGVPSACRMTTAFVAGGAVDGELDVRQHPVGVGVGDEQRAAFAGGRGGELVAVDEPDAGLDRVDAEPGVGDVEERHRRQDLELDVRVAPSAQRSRR